MKFNFEVTKHNIRFIRFKNFYFIKSCRGTNCFECELNDENDCFGVLKKIEKYFYCLRKEGFDFLL